MKFLLSVFLVLIFITNNAFSQQDAMSAELGKASAIANSSDRLSAYDSILEKYGIRSKPTQAADVKTPESKWSVSEKTDPLDGKRIITFFLQADSGQSHIVRKPVSLVIRWTAGKNELYVNWGNYLGSDGAWVTTKIDEGSQEIFQWGLSTNDTSTFFPRAITLEKDPVKGNVRFRKRPKKEDKDEDDITSFIKRLLVAKQIIVRVTPYRESDLTAIFDLTGLKSAAEPYKGDLKWF